jgi:hypothetical protein
MGLVHRPLIVALSPSYPDRPSPCKARFRLAGWPLREGVEPWIAMKGFRALQDLSWALLSHSQPGVFADVCLRGVIMENERLC